MPAVTDMVERYLPLLVTAGDYAREIQPRISGPATKPGSNPWVQAITDADGAVQNFLEVATLAAFPGVGFYGEEQDQSRNARYFPAEPELQVWLDPINGTFLYQNQQPGWDIILSITRKGRLVAAISYMPVRERFYLAVEGRGAFTGGRESRRLADMETLRTRPGSGVCLGYQAPDLLACLKPAFTALDIVADYDPDRGHDNLNDLFTGRLDGFLARQADLLDWGAMAFITVQAGGVATAPDGSALDIFEDFRLRQADLLVGSSPEVHARMRAAVG
jgi:fructose-1,6-bisphosphatase/inositol monophosphatase family enzyme